MLGLHFTPVCILLSVCSLHFTLSLHFTPGPQSAVRSLRFTLTAFGNTLWTQNKNIGDAYSMLILSEVKLHLARYSNGEMTVNQYFHNLQKKNHNKKKNSKAVLSFTHLSRDCDFIKSFVTQWTLFFVRVIKSDSYSCFGYTSLPTLVNELL